MAKQMVAFLKGCNFNIQYLNDQNELTSVSFFDFLYDGMVFSRTTSTVFKSELVEANKMNDLSDFIQKAYI